MKVRNFRSSTQLRKSMNAYSRSLKKAMSRYSSLTCLRSKFLLIIDESIGSERKKFI